MGTDSLVERLHRWTAIAAVPVMVAELLFPMVAGSTSAKLTLVLVALSVLVNARFEVGWRWAAHATVFGAYLLIAMMQSDFVISSFFVADFQVGLQGLLLCAVLVPMLANAENRERYFHDSAVALAAVGLIGAATGIAKLYLQTRGVTIAALEWQGMYPRGTSLRIDYNVYALGLIVSLVAAMALLASARSLAWQRLLASVAVPLIFFAVTFTSSRRGLLFLVLAVPLMAVSASGRALRLRMLRVPLVSLGGAGALILALLLNGDAPALQRVSEYLDLARAAERVLAVSEAGQLFETRAPLVADAWNEVSRESSGLAAMFGGGDGYLREMGRVFNREVDYEYPHNLLLSAVLHGGVVFGGFVLLGLAAAGLFTWRSRTQDLWLFAAIVFVALFALTSASSVYSFDLLVTLVLIGSCGHALRGRDQLVEGAPGMVAS